MADLVKDSRPLFITQRIGRSSSCQDNQSGIYFTDQDSFHDHALNLSTGAKRYIAAPLLLLARVIDNIYNHNEEDIYA